MIPDSSKWGEGDPCGGGSDCEGPKTVESMQRLCWSEIDPTSWNVSPVDGDSYGDGFFEIMSTLKGPVDDVVMGQVGNERAESMNEANIAGHRLILGHECQPEGPAGPRIDTILAIDTEGRMAAIGFGSELFTTVPIAQGAASSGADTAEDYLLSILGS